MATSFTGDTNVTAMTRRASFTPASHTTDMIEALPAGCVHRCFKDMQKLRLDAQHVLDTLEQNDEHGNQYLVVRSLTKQAINKLSNDMSCLGVTFRFEFEGTTGIIKIMPGYRHETITNHVVETVNEDLSGMGINKYYRTWGGASTFRGQPASGKQADQIFWPPSCAPSRVPPVQPGWPTLVVETALTESYPKLERDAKWWFEHSQGDVRIVILIVMRTSYYCFEKWQLAPANAPKPVTRVYEDQLKSNAVLLPPMGRQLLVNQHPYCHHKVEVDLATNTVTGVPTSAPMILPFEAIYDRPAGPNERDLVFTAQDFLYMANI